MFKQMLAVQWRFTRKTIAAVSVLVAILPALTMRISVVSTVNFTPRGLVQQSIALGFTLAMFAAVTGMFVYEATWRSDTSGKNVYLLSLPITWRQFMLNRLSGALLLLLLPALCLWVGGVIGTAFVPLPPTLHVYALGVAFRFFLASALTYCLWSALVQFSGQKATLVFLAMLLLAVIVPVIISMTGTALPIDTIFRWIADPPSPVSVFFSRWAIIDV